MNAIIFGTNDIIITKITRKQINVETTLSKASDASDFAPSHG